MTARLRPGVRFACFGDGLCCTDIHAIGPLAEPEVEMLRVFSDELIDELDGHKVMTAKVDGGCMFLTEGGCALHAKLGPDVKPVTCQQFPFHLVATPTSARVTTEQRCPCRTLGDRPPVTEVPPAIDGAVPDRQVKGAVRWDATREAPFAEYEAAEAVWIEALLSGALPEELATPRLDAPGLDKLVAELVVEDIATRYGAALRCFGGALQAMRGGDVDVERPAWADAFDRAEARTAAEQAPEPMLFDWAADALWSLDWERRGTVTQALAEIALRLGVARWLTARWSAEGSRPDRAAAEAIAVVELAGLSDDWAELVGTL